MNRSLFLGEGARGHRPLPPPPALPSKNSAIINPGRESGEDAVAARVVMACTRPDYQLLSRLVGAKQPPRSVWGCAVRSGSWAERTVTVAGPVLGAPYAAMVLEKLIALGAKAVIVLGWCGSLQAQVRLGSLVIPTAAVGGDGTSPHYRFGEDDLKPHAGLVDCLEHHLVDSLSEGVPWHAGPVWTTDAYYRETVAAVRHYQSKGILAVDLEMAALFAVGRFRGVPMAGILVVSDELFTLTWRLGFRSGRLRQAREAAARAGLGALTAWKDDDA